MIRRTLILPLILWLIAAAPAAAQDAVPPVELERAVFRAFERQQYDEALQLIEAFLEQAPRNVDMLYNAACAHSRLGNRDEAARLLYRSVEAGFRDFTHMKRDPDLEAIRDHPTFTAILEAADRVPAGGDRAFSAVVRWRENFGEEHYRYEKDERHRLWFATALDQVSHDEMRGMLERQADQMIESLFGEPPSYEVLVAIPTPADARRLFQDGDHIGGIYQHAQRRLIARDIGNALRHEFFHLMHYGHMERLRQRHRLWVQEGIASLYEDYEIDSDGKIRFLPNGRHNIVHRRARGGGLMRWDRLFDMTPDQFMDRASHLYPQVRSIFEYLAEQGKLESWYRAYVANFAEDPSGAMAFEVVFAKPVKEAERDWRKWVIARPPIDVAIEYGDASLGIETGSRAGNDGVLVRRVFPGSGASRSGIRRGDVIVAIDGEPTRSLGELQATIATRRVGERVRVRIRRDDEYLTLTTELRPLTPASRSFR